MSSISNSLASQTPTPAAAPATASPTDPKSLTSEQTFLKLLVAQIKNQDPLNPTDSVQFVGQ
ncbi:MAG: flagellar hook capping FlgD N-terminal domain-containing protein [Bryobacteraceae bacterium]